MPLNRITGTAFSGSPAGILPLGRPYIPPQQAFERIQGISRRLQEVLEDPGLRWKPPAPQQNFAQGLQQFKENNWSGYGKFAQEPGGVNTYQSPLQPAPPAIDLSPAARSQRTSLGVGRMMPGGEQMQDRFMGSSPLAGQANYLAQGQGLAAAGLGTMIPGPYGQIGQFIEKRPLVMEEAAAAMPDLRDRAARAAATTNFVTRNEGGLAYTSKAQALREQGLESEAADLEAATAERVARVKRDREAAGLPVGPAARRAEREQKKMDRMLKVQGRRLQQMGVSPLSPQAALIAPEAFNRAREAMQGGAGASPLISAAGQPVIPVTQGAAKTPVTMDQAANAYDAILRNTPLFAAAGIELGEDYKSAPPLNQVVPRVNTWLKESGGSLSEQDLEGLHKLVIQAAQSAQKDGNPFIGTRMPFLGSSSTETWNSLSMLERLSKIPENNKQARQQWWNEYSKYIMGTPGAENPTPLRPPEQPGEPNPEGSPLRRPISGRLL